MTSLSELDFLRSAGIHTSKRLHLEILLGWNMRCPMCTFHDALGKIEQRPFGRIKKLDDKLDYFGSVHIGDGSEPLINSDWDTIVDHFSNMGVKVSLKTNVKMIRDLRFAKRIVRSREFQ